MTAPKHPWLEPDDRFEGVGAHRDNPRYDPVDEFPPHNPDFPDVNPATGDERETTDGEPDAA